MIDVSALVGDIPTTPITIRTWGTPTVNDFGEPVHGDPTEVERDCVVHPSGRRELQRLGLDFARETISVYDTAAIVGIGATRPAEIDYAGRTYEVVRVGDYLELGGICLVHAALVDRDQGSP